MIFTPDGLEVRRLLYYPIRHVVAEKAPIYFKNTTELSVRSNKFLKILFYILFFPFKYKISVIASRNVCHSKYFSLPFTRRNAKEKIDKNEIAGIFSRYLWKCLEINKKEFSVANEYDDLSVVLVNNQVVNATVDGKNYARPDSIFEVSGKNVGLGIVQTFAYRPFYSALAKNLPRRAIFRDFYEYGFNLPLSVTLQHLENSKKPNKRFVFAGMEDSETKVYVFDGTVLSFKDFFAFGSQSFYQIMNYVYGVEHSAYSLMLDKLTKDDVGPAVKKRFKEILDKELFRLYNGLLSFKKNANAASVYIDGDRISNYLKTNKRFSGMLVDGGYCERQSKVNLSGLDIDNVLRADVGCMLGLSRNDEINVMATKQIRWLLPHTMEVR